MQNKIKVIIITLKKNNRMINKNNLLVGILVGFFAQILTFFQLQGQLKYNWIRDNYWLTVLAGIPISMLFMYSVKNMITAFNGEMWPSRLIGFSIGAIVFTLLSWKVFDEPLTTKTYVCLFLSFLILMIQLFWK
jgi:hypothetical protein